jgi:hypothetical protein
MVSFRNGRCLQYNIDKKGTELNVGLLGCDACGLGVGYHCFGGTYCLHLQGRTWRQYVPLKC